MKDLDGVSEADYGDHYKQHILEMYKLCVEMADRVSRRRQTVNGFFLSANSALIPIAGYFGLGKDNAFLYVPIVTCGVLLCLLWRRILKTYRDLNASKYEVINALEERLPARPFYTEWRRLSSRSYREKTAIEGLVAWAFLLVHLVVMGVGVIKGAL